MNKDAVREKTRDDKRSEGSESSRQKNVNYCKASTPKERRWVLVKERKSLSFAGGKKDQDLKEGGAWDSGHVLVTGFWATNTKLIEESSAFETSWQWPGSREGLCLIHYRCPWAKTAGLLQACKREQRWHWWMRSEDGSGTLVHDCMIGDAGNWSTMPKRSVRRVEQHWRLVRRSTSVHEAQQTPANRSVGRRGSASPQHTR